MTLNLKRKLRAILWLLIVTALLCLPGKTLPDTGGDWFNRIYADKWIHIFLFTILTVLFCKTVVGTSGSRQNIMRLYAIIAGCAALYGVLMEFVQLWLVSGRGFEVYDILADAAGCVIGYFISLKGNAAGKAEKR